MLMLTHSHEEMDMLLGEMGNVLHYYEDRVASITTALNECSHEFKFAREACALLQNILTDTSVQLQKCKKLFSPYISLNCQETASTCSDNRLSESSDDSDLSDHDLF